MYYNILDKKRLSALPLLSEFKNDFYLAGGTALALQLGHRDSVDFDFFSKNNIDTKKLFQKIKKIFNKRKILKVQDEQNTLTVYIDDNIKISFFTYQYKLISKLLDEPCLKLASINDIGAMKLSAITSRASNKDYIDIYYILKQTSLNKLLQNANKKLPELDRNLILKSLVYFKDIEKEPIKFKNKNKIEFLKIQEFLINEVRNIKIVMKSKII